jgi:hypothetical protein
MENRSGVFIVNRKEDKTITYHNSNKISEIVNKRDIIYLSDGIHLICYPYTINNLHEMANRLGIKRCWFHKNHYDIPKRRINEIISKCQKIDSKTIVMIIKGEYEVEGV